MLEIQQASYAYSDSQNAVLKNMSLTVAPGEYVAIVGSNGSGKSTLGRLMRGSLVPTDGAVLVDGHAATSHEAWPLVGLIQQDPTAQMVSSLVRDEVAFGPRNLGLDPRDIDERVFKALSACDALPLRDRSVNELSGGQQQRVALAAVLALEPRYLVADEASSQLDATGRANFSRLLHKLSQNNVGVIAITHLLEQVVWADRIVVLDAGRIVWDGPTQEFMVSDELMGVSGLDQDPLARPLGLVLRSGYGLSRLQHDSGTAGRATDDVAGFANRTGIKPQLGSTVWQELHGLSAPTQPPAEVPSAATQPPASTPLSPMLNVCNVTVRYEGAPSPALQNVSLAFPAGALTFVAGQSGSGKSTLARVLAGVLQPDTGEVTLAGEPVEPGEVGLAFQRPEGQLFCSTVLQDVAFGPLNEGLSQAEADNKAKEALADLGVPSSLWERSPFELSGGEQRRAALAGIVAMGSDACVFDEPTAGLDGSSRRLLHEVVRRLCERGCVVVVVSHDVDEWLPLARDVVLLHEGCVVYAGDAEPCRASVRPYERAFLPAPTLVQLGVALGAQEASQQLTYLSRSSVGGHLQNADAEPDASGRRKAHRSKKAAPQRIALPVGEYVAKSSPFHRLDARVKVLLALALTVATFAANSFLAVVLLLAGIVACERVAGVSGRALARSLKPALVVLAFALLANALRADGTGDLPLVGMLGLSWAGAARGITAVARIVTVVAGVLVVSASTTGPQIADAMGGLLRPLGRLGVPVDDLSMVLSVALRFLPESVRTFDQIHAAQRARGARFGEGGLRNRLGKWVAVLVPMVVVLFRRADLLAQAMRDRCYGYGPRTSSCARLSRRDLAVLLGGCALMVAVCRLVP